MASRRTETPLPDEMIEEIFYHLPAKSIFRFKCLSKKWLAKISDPRFARRCSSREGGSWGLFFQNTEDLQSQLRFISITHDNEVESYTPPRLSLDFLPQPFVYVVASSNDLVLCSPTKFSQTIYYVCNPMTRQWVTLPRCLKCHWVNVSFLSPIDDYGKAPTFTVVRLIRRRSSIFSFFEIETFSSCSEEWTISEVSYPALPDRFFFVFKGTLYWLDHQKQSIVAYDLIDNHFHLIALPGDSQNIHFFNPIGGRLSVFEEQLRYLEINSRRFIFCVWVLKEGEWSLERNIRFRIIEAQVCRIVVEFLGDESFRKPSRIVIEDSQETSTYGYQLLNDDAFIQLLAFNPLNRRVVILRVQDQILSYDFASRRLCLSRAQAGFCESMVFPYMHLPWPTRIQSPSWKTPAGQPACSPPC